MASTAQLMFEVRVTLGPMLAGTFLGSVFLGITFLQTIIYYRTFPQDSLFLKSVVGALCVLDTFSLVMWMHATYWFLVLNFGDFRAAASVIWSETEPVVTGVIALIVHLFLIWRIKILEPRWAGFCIVLVIASIIVCFASTAATIIVAIGIVKGTAVGVVNTELQWCGLTGDSFAVLVDLGIAATITYLVRRGRGYEGTNRLVNAVTVYIVSNGVITTIFRVVELGLALRYPSYLYVLIPYIPTSKAYTNALLATLNSRAHRRSPEFAEGPTSDIEWRGGTTVESMEWIGMSGQGQTTSNCSTKVDPTKVEPTKVNTFKVDPNKVDTTEASTFSEDAKPCASRFSTDAAL